MTTYAERFVRFGVALLSVALFLAVLTLAHSPLPAVAGTAATQLISALKVSGRYLGLGLAAGLPMALLLGVPAGLKAGTRLDRSLLMPLGLLATVPVPILTMLYFYPLVLERRALDMRDTALLTVATAAVIFVAPAIRDRLAQAGAGVTKRLAAALGAVLQQAGNVVVAVAVVEQYYPLGGGLFRLLADAFRTKAHGLFLAALATLIVPVLLCHLVGDLLATWSQGRPRTERWEGRRGWAGLGLLLALVLVALSLATFAPPTPEPGPRSLAPGAGHLLGTDLLGRDMLAVLSSGVRNALAHGASATYVALLAGGVLGAAAARSGRWGAVLLSPEVSLPSLFPPVVALLAGAVLFGSKGWAPAVLAGIACAPALAPWFRRVADATCWPVRRQALAAVLGAALLVLAQVIAAEMSINPFRAFADGTGLNGVVGATLRLKEHPHQFLVYPLLALGLGGIGLLGRSLAQPRAQD